MVNRRLSRRGLSLVELIAASAIMAMIAAALGTVAFAVQRLSAAASGVQETVQHARVVSETFLRTINEAQGNVDFPGVVVFAEQVGVESLPETLVVWSPEGAAADPAGLPRFSELVVLCPNPENPNQLVAISNRSDTREVPPLTDVTAWKTELAAFKRDNIAQAVVLTDRLRVVMLASGATEADRRRGAVRFFVEQRPSPAEFADYADGTTAWLDMAWPLGIANSETGVARARCNVEFQLAVPDSESDEVLAFYDAASVHFVVANPNAQPAVAIPAIPAVPAAPAVGP